MKFPWLKKRIYLDYASLTPIDARVLKVMRQYSGTEFANPSSWYREGVSAKKAMEAGRKIVADFIHAHSDEIIFTASGTEANNLAILGPIHELHEQGVEYADMHVVASAIEHSSIRECLTQLDDLGVATSLAPVNVQGLVMLEELKKLIRPNTVLVSVMTVNNEIGSIQPLREIAKMIRQARKQFEQNSIYNFQSTVKYPLFHTDAAQAALYQDLNVEKLGVDLLTLDGSKVCGPRGIGALYKKRYLKLTPIILGGGQERGLRSGTENLPGIMGLAKALEIARMERDREAVRIGELRRQFIQGLKAVRKDISVNGPSDEVSVSPHILNVAFPRLDAEFMIMKLDAGGVACSTKSSCLRDQEESYVLKAIGADSRASIRFSLGRYTRSADISEALKVIGAKLA